MRCRVQDKVGYSKREYAVAAIPGQKAKYGQDYRVYRCNGCREWHLTTQVKYFGGVGLDALDKTASV